jgi:hypothetical protein
LLRCQNRFERRGYVCIWKNNGAALMFGLLDLQ